MKRLSRPISHQANSFNNAAVATERRRTILPNRRSPTRTANNNYHSLSNCNPNSPVMAYSLSTPHRRSSSSAAISEISQTKNELLPISISIHDTSHKCKTLSPPPQSPASPETCSNCNPQTPAPKWSFHKRKLPSNLVSLSSPLGKRLFRESLSSGNAESYFPLSEQFLTQSDPAYCGLTSLVMSLNALSIDPNVRWRGGWRWFDEDMLLRGCCVDRRSVKRIGIVMEQFLQMGRCHGARIVMKRPQELYDLRSFREDVMESVSSSEARDGFLISSFSRSALGQTGDGHFSPVAAYHEGTDSVLILDVARFKYAPYWVDLKELYEAMVVEDEVTRKSRGWFNVSSPDKVLARKQICREKKRPGELVDVNRERCPVGDIKIMFCKANSAFFTK